MEYPEPGFEFIQSWLHAIADESSSDAPYEAAKSNHTCAPNHAQCGSRKRRKLTVTRAPAEQYLPSPPTVPSTVSSRTESRDNSNSQVGRADRPYRKARRGMAQPAPKRPLGDIADQRGSEEQDTESALPSRSGFTAHTIPMPSHYPTAYGRSIIASRTSSEAGSTTTTTTADRKNNHGPKSRESSPSKRIRRAQISLTFHLDNFHPTAALPPTLQTLYHDLRHIEFGLGVLPAEMREPLEDLGLPEFFFSPQTEGPLDYRHPEIRLPSRRYTKALWQRATEAERSNSHEAEWNDKVHGSIFRQLLTEDEVPIRMTQYHYCTTSGIIPDFLDTKPGRVRASPRSQIDYCLCIKPFEAHDQNVIDAVAAVRPGATINHTPGGGHNMSRQPVVISVETKRQGEDWEAALFQMGNWHTAQWRSLHWAENDDTSEQGPISAIQFLAGIIIQGHDWQFVATTPGIASNEIETERSLRLLLPALRLGDTRSEAGIYKLFVALDRLVQWAEKEYWPAFRNHLLSV